MFDRLTKLQHTLVSTWWSKYTNRSLKAQTKFIYIIIYIITNLNIYWGHSSTPVLRCIKSMWKDSVALWHHNGGSDKQTAVCSHVTTAFCHRSGDVCTCTPLLKRVYRTCVLFLWLNESEMQSAVFKECTWLCWLLQDVINKVNHSYAQF